MNPRPSIRQTLIVVIAGMLLAALALPSLAEGTPPNASAPSRLSLPPRPTPQPTPIPPGPSVPHQPPPEGAYIDLRVAPYRTGHWTLIQWQDAWGDWHDVEGWQGTLNEGSHKFWWVARGNFGEGPFRWLIFDALDGELLSTSRPFHLPDTPDETVTVDVCLLPDADVCDPGE
jgi:hypothetical protein